MTLHKQTKQKNNKNLHQRIPFGAVFERGCFMKKTISIIFTLIMLFSFAVSVSAEEFNGADLFTVDLPENFEQTGTSASNFSFTNENGDIFAVSYSDNTQEDTVFSPTDMSQKEIEEYTKTLSEESKTVMNDYADEFEMTFLSGKKVKHKNGKTALVCQTKTTIKKGDNTGVFYQTMYEFGCKDYKYTFTYTTSDEDKKSDFKDTFDSIDIFEAETETNLDKLKGYAIAGAVCLLIMVGIIRFIRTPEKRAQGKLK